MKPMKAYWFSKNGISKYGDREPFVVRDDPYEVDGEIRACYNGLHASVHPLDALQYAHGSTLDLVELSGMIVSGGDKHAASHRKHVKRIDAEKILWEFSRWCALELADQWDMPPIVRQFLETGDETLREEARAAAAHAVARAATARATAWDAAWDAAWAAAHAAGYAMAHAAARAAARAASSAAQRDKFQELVDQAFAEAEA